MMRSLLFITLSVSAIVHASFAASLTPLERAVLALPPEALADIPLIERQVFLAHLAKDTPHNKRLDTKNGFLEFYSDGETPFHASSMLYMKTFQRNDGGSIVLCHMPKPHSDGGPPQNGQTFVFTRHEGRWVDITAQILPKEVNSQWRFQPRRTSSVIETGPYERIARRDGRGNTYSAERREKDLVWNGKEFRVRKAQSPKFSYDSL